MAQHKPDISALVGSRICHDLISPIGAIGNGMELMALSGLGGGAEMALINSSVGNANARIRFYRIAFGHSGAGHPVAITEVRDILRALSDGARVVFSSRHDRDIPRDQLRAIFLAMMCLESALPHGGEVTLEQRAAGGWRIAAAQAPGNAEVWARLTGYETGHETGHAPPASGGPAGGLGPGQVEFALLPRAVADLGRRLQVSPPDSALAICF